MKRAKNIFNTGRSAKLDYEMLINNIMSTKTMPVSKSIKLIHKMQFTFAENEFDDCSSQ